MPRVKKHSSRPERRAAQSGHMPQKNRANANPSLFRAPIGSLPTTVMPIRLSPPAESESPKSTLRYSNGFPPFLLQLSPSTQTLPRRRWRPTGPDHVGAQKRECPQRDGRNHCARAAKSQKLPHGLQGAREPVRRTDGTAAGLPMSTASGCNQHGQCTRCAGTNISDEAPPRCGPFRCCKRSDSLTAANGIRFQPERLQFGGPAVCSRPNPAFGATQSAIGFASHVRSSNQPNTAAPTRVWA